MFKEFFSVTRFFSFMPCAYIRRFSEIIVEYIFKFFRVGFFVSVRPFNAFIVIVVVIAFTVNICFISSVNKVSVPGIVYHFIEIAYEFLVGHPVYFFRVCVCYPVEDRKFNIVKLVIKNVTGHLLCF